VGALLAGVIGDAFGLAWAIGGVGVLTFVSGTVVALAMRESGKHPSPVVPETKTA
jgi:hypothetical protein